MSVSTELDEVSAERPRWEPVTVGNSPGFSSVVVDVYAHPD